MIELTLEQRQAVSKQGENPPRAIDPDTDTTYVLIPEAIYARFKALLIEEQNSSFLMRCIFPRWKYSVEKDGMILQWISTMISILGDRHEYSTR